MLILSILPPRNFEKIPNIVMLMKSANLEIVSKRIVFKEEI